MNKILYFLFFSFFTFIFFSSLYFFIDNIIEDNNKTYLDYSKIDFQFYLKKLNIETNQPILKCKNYENKTTIYHHNSEFEIYAYIENKEIILCHSLD